MFFANLLRGMLTTMAVPASAGEAAPEGTAPEGASGSADDGAPAPGNAEEKSLESAFGGKSGAGAEGREAGGTTPKGDKAAGGSGTGGGDVSTETAPAWFEQLPKEMRDNPDITSKLAKYRKIGDMAKTIMELEGKAATADVPETAEGYSFANDREKGGDVLARVAHRAGLTAEQAETVYGSLNELGAERLRAVAEAQKRQLLETDAALKTEYGSGYAEKMELLTRGLDAAGPNAANLLRQAGLAGNPEIVKAFIALGEAAAESGSTRGKGPAGDSFIPTSEGGSFYKDT